MELLCCFFFQMKLSSTLFVVMILGIVSLSSANRIPPHQPSCVTYCGNYAKRCDLQLQGCPLESCDIGDRDCLFNECMAYFNCHIQRKREKSDVIVETIWGSKAVDKEFSYCESWTERNNSKSLFLHFVYDSLMWCNSKVCDDKFSNSLIIHQVKTKEITTVKEVWIPDLN